jgi:hypothetical protein
VEVDETAFMTMGRNAKKRSMFHRLLCLINFAAETYHAGIVICLFTSTMMN